MIAVAGGENIRCAPYATYGTPKLSKHVLTALHGRFACLLGYHGMIAIGSFLPEDEIERVRLKMAGYGHADA